MKTPSVHKNERGIALLITLTILAIVLILLIAFATSMRTERIAAKNFSELTKAKMLAEGAVDEAVALIADATRIPSTTFTWTAAPGIVYQKTSGGSFVAKPLYSIGPDTYDINSSYFITGISTYYNPTTKPAPINVSWENITANGELVGRMAFWVDNEMAKVNVNYAKWRDTTTINESNPTNIDLRALEPPFYGLTVPQINDFWKAHTTPPASSNWFSTLEEMRRGFSPLMPAEGLNSNKFYTTVSTTDTNTDAFGRPRVDLNSLTAADIPSGSLIRSKLADTTWATTLYNGIVTDAQRDTIQKKYGDYGVEQILANIIEYKKPYVATDTATGAENSNRDADGIPQRYCGLKRFPLLGEIMIQAATTNIITSASPGVTNYNIQVTVYCDARLVNPYTIARGSGGTVKFLANSITVEASPAAVPAFTFSLTEVTRSITADVQPQSQKNLNSNWQPGGVLGQRIANTPLNSMWRANVAYTDTDGVAPTIAKIIVSMHKVRLLRSTGDETIQDWATPQDFSAAYPSGMEFSPTSPNGGRVVADIQTGNGTGLQGSGDSPRFSTVGTSDARGARLDIAKNDPRVRTFPGHSADAALGLAPPTAWFRPQSSSGGSCAPTDAACASRPTASPAADVLGWTPTLTEPTKFTQNYYKLLVDNRDVISPNSSSVPQQEAQSTFFIKQAPFDSPGELSYIHTGYQWRNVRLRASVAYTGTAPAGPVSSDPNRPIYLASERDALQDWVVLDMFSIGDGIAPGRVGLNTLFAGPAAGLSPRTVPLQAVLNAVTANLSIGGLAEPQLNSIGQNIANRAFASNSTVATSSPYIAIPAYFTPGEFCEVYDMDWYNDPRGGGAYDLWPGKTDREQTIRRVSNLVTSRSNLFTIWAIAQSIKEVGTPNGTLNGQDFVSGEVKVEAIVERYEEGSTVKFRTRYYRFIYD